jgi:hypothetical protein
MPDKYNELDTGSPYALIGKLEKRIERAEAAIVKLIGKNDELRSLVGDLKQSIRTANQSSKEARAIASKVSDEIVASVSKVATHRKRSAKEDPFYHKWIEFIKKNFVSVKYISEKDCKDGTGYAILEIRKELASHFGNHILDDEYISSHAISRLVKEAGFTTSKYTYALWSHNDEGQLVERKMKPFLIKKKV